MVGGGGWWWGGGVFNSSLKTVGSFFTTWIFSGPIPENTDTFYLGSKLDTPHLKYFVKYMYAIQILDDWTKNDKHFLFVLHECEEFVYYIIYISVSFMQGLIYQLIENYWSSEAFFLKGSWRLEAYLFCIPVSTLQIKRL